MNLILGFIADAFGVIQPIIGYTSRLPPSSEYSNSEVRSSKKTYNSLGVSAVKNTLDVCDYTHFCLQSLTRSVAIQTAMYIIFQRALEGTIASALFILTFVVPLANYI